MRLNFDVNTQPGDITPIKTFCLKPQHVCQK